MLPTPTRLRQIALVAEDLEKATKLLTTVIGTEVIYTDPAVEQWGLKNILLPIGGDIIEVVSPFKPDTTASRLLSKRGDGGYMIIMQTSDAITRRKYLEENNMARVIFTHKTEDSICIQYHPKGIKVGGVIPELDSHRPSSSNPNPLEDPFSPWHALGPPSNHSQHSQVMKKYSYLHMLSVTCRLTPGDDDIVNATGQWGNLFGVRRGDAKGECQFINAKLTFLPGREGEKDGLVEVCIGVENDAQLADIMVRAKANGVLNEDSQVEIIGIRWKFISFQNQGEISGRQVRL
ncbi:hypothetical protein BGZ60DRAFT_367492 [Tricladium varicosporioides]|nr:hypothetical protein BGZ60DRAFT_367492 [Hymenoscyphus varicosporioides]